MKRFTKKEFKDLEEKIYSVGCDLAIITSLVKFLELALEHDYELTNVDFENLTTLLKNQVFQINTKYDKIECMLGV